MPETTTRLTKRAVDQALPGPSRYILWDSDISGFGIRIETSGKKTYIVRYRPKGLGRTAPKRFMTIGRHGHLTPDQARAQAQNILGAVAVGSDPAAQVAAAKAAMIVKDAIDLYLKEHVNPKRKERTALEYTSALKRHVIPEIGNRPAEKVTRADLLKLHHKMKDSPIQANRTLSIVSSLYTFLGKREIVPEGYNPVRGIDKYPEQGRERYLTSEELGRLGAALIEAETIGLPWQVDETKPKAKHLAAPENRRTKPEPAAIAALRLLLFTGARLREILHLRWQEVDLERGMAFLPDSKTGRKPLMFSNVALEVLKSLPKNSVYVIEGAKKDQPRADLKKPWAAIQLRASLEGVRLHDLRHTFASIGTGASLGLPIVGKLLGHTQPRTTARYAHLDADPLRRAADLISTQISSAMERA
ncbi:tyrosine-type recombinase/integrase [Microvirga sp. BT291]|nr:tyrosine-type recombinase/integrase [Microvirga pudoricolor]